MGMTLISKQAMDFQHPALPIDGSESLMEFLLDADTDAQDLPTADVIIDGKNFGAPAPGSHALSIASGSEYYLDSSSSWEQLNPPESETP